MLTYSKASKRMEKLTLIFKVSLLVGIPAYSGYFANVLLKVWSFDDLKSLILFIIACASGLIWLGINFLKFIEKMIETDDKVSAWRKRKVKHKGNEKPH